MASGHRIVNASFTMLRHSRDPGKLNLHAFNLRVASVRLMRICLVLLSRYRLRLFLNGANRLCLR